MEFFFIYFLKFLSTVSLPYQNKVRAAAPQYRPFIIRNQSRDDIRGVLKVVLLFIQPKLPFISHPSSNPTRAITIECKNMSSVRSIFSSLTLKRVGKAMIPKPDDTF